MDALCTWERETGRGSKLLLVPDADDEEIVFAMDGKPVTHSPFIIGLTLDAIKDKVMPKVQTSDETGDKNE